MVDESVFMQRATAEAGRRAACGRQDRERRGLRLSCELTSARSC